MVYDHDSRTGAIWETLTLLLSYYDIRVNLDATSLAILGEDHFFGDSSALLLPLCCFNIPLGVWGLQFNSRRWKTVWCFLVHHKERKKSLELQRSWSVMLRGDRIFYWISVNGRTEYRKFSEGAVHINLIKIPV